MALRSLGPLAPLRLTLMESSQGGSPIPGRMLPDVPLQLRSSVQFLASTIVPPISPLYNLHVHLHVIECTNRLRNPHQRHAFFEINTFGPYCGTPRALKIHIVTYPVAMFERPQHS